MTVSDATTPGGPVVEFRDVSKFYPPGRFGASPQAALLGVSFDLKPGEILGLVGPNRAGKTTLLKTLLGVTNLSAGRILRFGTDASDRSTLARVGYVHENQSFPPYLTAAELLRFYGTVGGAPRLAERVPDLLERVGLADRAREPIRRFSKGMSQRLALAQALLGAPELLVLDEPTEGLDFEGRRLIRAVVAETRSAGGTVILVSHSLAEVELLCTRLAVLRRGRLVYFGDKQELAPKPGDLEPALERLYTQQEAA
jgi:ABC-2 type transport system ATP-binding protein